MKKVTKLKPKPTLKKKLRVAAYCRVSRDSERLLHSLSAQVSYYNQLIQSNPDWDFAGIYSDEGKSGTSTTRRNDFQRMIKDAEEGKIDIILTKSIQRFARNTVDLLETVRHLKELGVEVRFEKEHINSMTGDGELMMTILASFAQEEINSLSQNIKWGIKKKMESGKPHCRKALLGYRWQEDELVPYEPEASVIKRIFSEYLSGKKQMQIARGLNEDGIMTLLGNQWTSQAIKDILQNITYTGNLLLMKTYSPTPMKRGTVDNKGEKQKYFVENTHEPIINMEEFRQVQDEMKKRHLEGNQSHHFSRKIRSGVTGTVYYIDSKKPVDDLYWKNSKLKADEMGRLFNSQIEDLAVKALEITEFDPEVFAERITRIIAENWTLKFEFYDGHSVVMPYERSPELAAKRHKAGIKKAWDDPEKREARLKRFRETNRRKNAEKDNDDSSQY